MSTPENSVDAVVARVWSLDLETVRTRFRDSQIGGGQGSDDASLLAERSYREFLVLTALYPEARLVPTPETDEFWHLHILDTLKYQRDCQQALGFFLHHVPSLPDETEAEQEEKGARTLALVQRHFPGSPTLRTGGAGISSRCSGCRSIMELDRAEQARVVTL